MTNTISTRKSNPFFDMMADPFDFFFSPSVMPASVPSHHHAFSKMGANLMRTDVKESDEAFEFAVDLPGLTKDNVTLELEDDCLTITAQTNEERVEKSGESKGESKGESGSGTESGAGTESGSGTDSKGGSGVDSKDGSGVDSKSDTKVDSGAKADSGIKVDSGAKSTYVRKERFSGKCTRRFFVGEDILPDEISASFKDGVLAITVPKKKPKLPVSEKRSIAIS